MGQRNSSLTRVQPVLSHLLARGGANWLPQFLQLGSRASLCSPKGFSHLGALRQSPAPSHSFEFPATAPADYLKALVGSPDRLRRAVEANPNILKSSKDPNVERMRRLLLEGNPEAIAEGLDHINRGRTRAGKGTWWVLEGTTMVDCAIFAEKATIFIEGKRTERTLTDRVSWDLARSQVFRNLDALRKMPHDDGGDYFALLVVEGGSEAEKAARGLDSDYKVASPSWPHLSQEQAEELYARHYLGFTTWEAIASTFGITLYDRISDHPLSTVTSNSPGGPQNDR